MRISHGVEHVAAGAASRPAGAADWAGPGAADEEVRLALRDGHGVPEAGAALRLVLVVGRVTARLQLATRVTHEPGVSGSHAPPREGVSVVVADARLDRPVGRRPRFGRLVLRLGVAHNAGREHLTGSFKSCIPLARHT